MQNKHTQIMPVNQGSNQQYYSIGSDNSLAPTSRQAIIWTYDDNFIMRHSASLS